VSERSITDVMIDLIVGLVSDRIGYLIGYPVLMWLEFSQSGWANTLG